MFIIKKGDYILNMESKHLLNAMSIYSLYSLFQK